MNPFTSKRSESVAALGEARLIARIRRWLGDRSPPSPGGIGDDCAVLPASRRSTLITVDPVIYGRHFDATVPPRAVGAKLLKRNLSDIAAMGGRPTAAVVSLTLDARTRTAWVEAFYRGMASTARRFGVRIVGGDVAQAEGSLAASLTLLGEAHPRRVLTRTGAKSGDWIFVTGELGRSLPTGHHWKFQPRLDAGAWLASQSTVRAMMDVSDGLAKDLRALTPPLTVPALDPEAVPRRDGADLRAALSDGEDYELLFAVAATQSPEAFARRWRKRFPRLRLSCLGRFVSGRQLPPGTIDLEEYRGYEHLR